MQRRYVHGAGVDDPVVWFEGSSNAASNRQYLLADERGSIVGITDNAGAVTNINTYDDWGIPDRDDPNDSNDSFNVGRFQYTGQIYLPEIGNDPMNATDPSGMSRCVMKTCDSLGVEGMEKFMLTVRSGQSKTSPILYPIGLYRVG